MAASRTLDRKALALVQGIVAANKGGDAGKALSLAEQGVTAFPEFTLPGVLPGGFASLVTQFSAAGASAPAAAPKPAPRKAPEAPKVETRTLRLVHDGVVQTSLFGVEKDSEAHRILGRKANGGLGWGWWAPTSAFYLRNTKGYAPDMERIGEAVTALESARQDGVQLYRVEQDITTTAADGTALPVYETRAQREARAREWQITYTGRMNSAEWLRGLDRAECVSCTRTGLNVRTSRITKDAEKFPQVQCLTCVGEPESASVDLSALALALDSKPAPLPEAEVCSSCRQLTEVKGGRFVLHTKPFTATACRGKVGVAPVKDVEPEAAAPKPAPRKARAAAPKAAPAPAAPAPVVDTQDLQAELSAALIAGDNAEVARVVAAMQERATAARDAAAAAAAESAKAAPAAELAELGKAWTFRTVEGISGATLKNSATAARTDLGRALAKAGLPLAKAHTTGEGVKVEVRRNKDDKTLTAVVVDLPAEGVPAAKLAKIVRDVVSAQRGVTTATAVKA